MTQKIIIFVIAVVLIATAVLAFSSQINPAAQTRAQSGSREAPDEIVYRHLFRHVAAFKAKADEAERQGKEARHYRRFFKHKANLSDEQAQILEQIASQCALEIEAIDERAKPIIEAYKAQYPNGQVPRGQTPSPPSPELQQMTKERNELVLRKRDELRAAFGENEFKRFREFVKNKVAVNGNAVSAEQ